MTAMCRALFRTGALYDAGPRADALHRHDFPLPGGWLRLQLTTPAALRFAWGVFELQTILESGVAPARPGRHLMPRGTALPAAVLSDAALDLFLSPTARSLYACPELEARRNACELRSRPLTGGCDFSIRLSSLLLEASSLQRPPGAQLFARAVLLLKACGRLCVEAAAPALALWGATVAHEARFAPTQPHLALARLQLARALTTLGVKSEADAIALLPPPPCLCRLMLADLDLDNGYSWAQLMAAPPPLRRALLRAASRLPFELVRRRNNRCLREVIVAEPQLAASVRDCGDDLLRRACAGRGLTHQMVSSMLRSGVFVACGGRGEVASAKASAQPVLAARLGCLAAARAVRNKKTLQVLHAAWGALVEVNLLVAATGSNAAGAASDGTQRIRLTLRPQ